MKITLPSITATLLVAFTGVSAVTHAAPLANGTTLTITAGTSCVEGAFVGSCFIMDLGGFPVPVLVAPGTDLGIVIGKNQKTGGQETQAGPFAPNITTPGEMTAAWDFFSGFGTFATATFSGVVSGTVTTDSTRNKFDSTSCAGAACTGLTELGTMNVAWVGVAVPIGSALGCNSVKCTPAHLSGIFISNWTVTPGTPYPTYKLDYSNVVPDGVADWGGTLFKLHLEGEIRDRVNVAPTCPATTNIGSIPTGQAFNWSVSGLTDGGDGPSPLVCSLNSASTNGTATVNSNCSNGTVTGTVTPTVGGSGTFRYAVNDGGTVNNTVNCAVTFTATSNQLPAANAGADQTVQPNTTVTLSGSATDADGTIASYLWTQTAGSPTVTLTGANTATATFTAPSVPVTGTTLTFRLTATDNNGGVSPSNDASTVVITVLPPPACESVHPVSSVTSAGGGQSGAVNGTLTLTFTGHLVTVKPNAVTGCPGLPITYEAVSTVGTPSCVVNSGAAAATGTVTPGDKLVCTNQPVGRDTDRFRILAGQ